MEQTLQDLNPWWSGGPVLPQGPPCVTRECFRDLVDQVMRPEEYRAAIVIGPRMVGKTTLVLQVIEHALRSGFPPENVLYADLELDPFRGVRLPDLLRGRPANARPGQPVLHVLDEIHYCRAWAQDLKVLVDRRAHRFLLTGSASRELLLGMEESLPGRYDRFDLFGLSLREFAQLRDLRSGRKHPLPAREHLMDYLERGGFPAHATATDLRLVRRRIQEDVSMRAISHDIVARLSGQKGRAIGDDEGLRRLFLHIVQHPGAKLNLKAMSAAIGISPITANRWLRALQEAALVRPLRAASSSGRPQHGHGKHPKLYAADPGIVAAYTVTGDLGRRAETAVHRHLLQARESLEGTGTSHPTLGYWQDAAQGEIDFLLRHDGRTLAIEVTTATPVPPEKIQAFARALRKLRPKAARNILLCLEAVPREVDVDDLRIEILPLEDVLLACSEPARLFSPEA